MHTVQTEEREQQPRWTTRKRKKKAKKKKKKKAKKAKKKKKKLQQHASVSSVFPYFASSSSLLFAFFFFIEFIARPITAFSLHSHGNVSVAPFDAFFFLLHSPRGLHVNEQQQSTRCRRSKSREEEQPTISSIRLGIESPTKY